MSLYWTVFSASLALVALQGWLAWRDNFFTVGQMQAHHAQQGIPFVAHTGMWGDIFIITPLMAYLVSKYALHWELDELSWAILAGLMLSLAMHLTYMEGGIIYPEAHAHNGYLTWAGQVHWLYMGLAFAVIALFYFATPRPAEDTVLVFGLLVIHVFLGVHGPLKLLEPSWFPYRGIFDLGTLVPIVGSAMILLALSWWALR